MHPSCPETLPMCLGKIFLQSQTPPLLLLHRVVETTFRLQVKWYSPLVTDL
jgi:hypothetical protein